MLDITLCDKVCQWLATGRWFSPGASVSSTNKTERHYITEILLKMTLNTLTLTFYFSFDVVMLQALAGSCAGHDCTAGSMCKSKTSDGKFECTFQCKYSIFYILRCLFGKFVKIKIWQQRCLWFPNIIPIAIHVHSELHSDQHLCLE